MTNPTHRGHAYVCIPCDEAFDSVKLWDEHLSQYHGMTAGDWP